MTPARTRTSATRAGPPVPSTTVPPRTSTSPTVPSSVGFGYDTLRHVSKSTARGWRAAPGPEDRRRRPGGHPLSPGRGRVRPAEFRAGRPAGGRDQTGDLPAVAVEDAPR